MAKITKKQNQVREFLLEKIGTGMKEGDLLPTIKDLSELVKVSQMTVHKAVDRLVEEGILRKVQGKGTFVGKVPGLPGKVLRFQNGKPMVAFVSPYSHNDLFMRDFTEGVMEGFDNNQFLLVNKHVWIPKFREEDVLLEMASCASGIILLSHLKAKAKQVLSELLSQDYPIVFMDHFPLETPCTAVCSDNEEGAYDATEYLYEMGHRNILHVSSNNGYSSTLARREGYQHCMLQHGLEPKIAVSEQEFAAGIKHVLARWGNPTAIFALHDGLATEIFHLLKEQKIRVPEDISIIGFNDDIGMNEFEVPLTTIAQPKKQIGRKAAKLMADLLEGRPVNNAKFFLPTKRVIRNSVCRINPAEDEVVNG